MKLVPGPLPPIPTGTNMDRFPLPLPFSPDFLWRYPLGFPTIPPATPTSPLMDYKSQLPTSLASDPRIWSRDDVSTFLRWAEREYDLQPIDMDKFQMNGNYLKTQINYYFSIIYIVYNQINLLSRYIIYSLIDITT